MYRYNGYQAVKYSHDPRNPRSLPNDRVSALFEDKLGRIWAGPQNGAARFNPETGDFSALALPDGPSSQRIVKAIIGDGGAGTRVASQRQGRQLQQLRRPDRGFRGRRLVRGAARRLTPTSIPAATPSKSRLPTSRAGGARSRRRYRSAA